MEDVVAEKLRKDPLPPIFESSSFRCLHDLLVLGAKRAPKAVAIAAPGRAPLTYANLHRQVEETVRCLNGLGVSRNDRVAIVLPNGPEMASAFLGVAAGATAAPLNPAYQQSEFDFYLRDLGAKALVMQTGDSSPVSAAARTLGIPLIELSPVPEGEAGLFDLRSQTRRRAVPARSFTGFAQPEDTALVLHTSGTTSRPKIVPLAQANLCASARNIGATLQLSPRDRCLNVMPLFHIHGLMAALLASLAAGASVVCTPGLNAPRFFNWMREFSPTWYTAVPTMHQAILGSAGANRPTIEEHLLRLIRSSSAALPPTVLAELEEVFGAPVIESYGMTEAAHQMASNPLPPRPRKPGSVGPAAGPEIAIMDEAGRLLPPRQNGEIVIRGDNVTPGYEGNPQANASAFTNGWFRTGDQGYLDDERYLFVTDRIKEIINRGGEKVSPREVEEVLLAHPAVLQAVAFAAPHARLGEDVAAAVVLKPGAEASERQLQKSAAARLADFKVPRCVVVLEEIPKGPTGKVQRISLAEKLGLVTAGQAQSGMRIDFVAPRTPVEETLAEIWVQVLGVDRVSIHDDFFDLGGDSLLAAQVISRVRATMQVELAQLSLFEESTLADLAVVVTSQAEQVEREEMASILAEIEELSDEEAEQLLADAIRRKTD
jgi:acyl-CoA synthetase (AMP-forming)/AMP-acid ligase II/acyl carrier protein